MIFGAAAQPFAQLRRYMDLKGSATRRPALCPADTGLAPGSCQWKYGMKGPNSLGLSLFYGSRAGRGGSGFPGTLFVAVYAVPKSPAMNALWTAVWERLLEGYRMIAAPANYPILTQRLQPALLLPGYRAQ